MQVNESRFTIAKIRSWYLRSTGYIGIMNFIMLIYLVITENMSILPFIILGIIGLIAYMFYDIKKVMGEETDYLWMKSSVIRQMIADIEEIKQNTKK